MISPHPLTMKLRPALTFLFLKNLLGSKTNVKALISIERPPSSLNVPSCRGTIVSGNFSGSILTADDCSAACSCSQEPFSCWGPYDGLGYARGLNDFDGVFGTVQTCGCFSANEEKWICFDETLLGTYPSSFESTNCTALIDNDEFSCNVVCNILQNTTGIVRHNYVFEATEGKSPSVKCTCIPEDITICETVSAKTSTPVTGSSTGVDPSNSTSTPARKDDGQDTLTKEIFGNATSTIAGSASGGDTVQTSAGTGGRVSSANKVGKAAAGLVIALSALLL